MPTSASTLQEEASIDEFFDLAATETLAGVAAHFDLTRPLVGGLYGGVVLAHLGLGFLGRPGDGAWLAAAETLLLVAGALATAAVATFWWLVPNPLANGSFRLGAVAFWSVLVSVIALPHVVVGSLLDRGRGIWHVL